MLRESIEMSRRLLGPEHPDVAGGATILAYWLTSAGEYDEAGQLLDDALATRRKALGNDHPQVASTLTVQANLFVARKQYTEALEGTTEALRILALSLPDDHGWSQWRKTCRVRRLRPPALPGRRKLLLASLPALSGSPIADLPQRGRAHSQTSIRPGANRKKPKSTPARPGCSHNTASARPARHGEVMYAPMGCTLCHGMPRARGIGNRPRHYSGIQDKIPRRRPVSTFDVARGLSRLQACLDFIAGSAERPANHHDRRSRPQCEQLYRAGELHGAGRSALHDSEHSRSHGEGAR